MKQPHRNQKTVNYNRSLRVWCDYCCYLSNTLNTNKKLKSWFKLSYSHIYSWEKYFNAVKNIRDYCNNPTQWNATPRNLTLTYLQTSWSSKRLSTSHFRLIIGKTTKVTVFFLTNTTRIFTHSNSILPRRHFHVVLVVCLRVL